MTPLADESLPAPPEDPLPGGLELDVDGERGAMRELVAKLPERQRMCVFLHCFADLDYAAIAAALGIRRGTVAASLHAARATLRDGLERGR